MIEVYVVLGKVIIQVLVRTRLIYCVIRLVKPNLLWSFLCFCHQLPQKRKRAAAKPSRGPKTARRPVQSASTPKRVQNSLDSFARDSEETSPKVSEATKSKLAAFSAADSVSIKGNRYTQWIFYVFTKRDNICDCQLLSYTQNLQKRSPLKVMK